MRLLGAVDFDGKRIRGVSFNMSKNGIFVKAAALLLSSLIFLSFTALSASASTAPVAYDDGSVLSSSIVIQTGWGSGDATDAPEPGDEGGGIETLLIILVTMTLLSFGALVFKLFSNRISKKELIILLFVLALVIVVVLIALCIIFADKGGGGQGTVALLTNKNIFWEVI